MAADIVWGKIDGTIREPLSVLGRGSYQGREKQRVEDGQGMRAEHIDEDEEKLIRKIFRRENLEEIKKDERNEERLDNWNQ